MTPTTTRLLKEARLQLWPWLVVAVAGVIRILQEHSITLNEIATLPLVREGIAPLCILAGVPLLATVSFGSEFRYGTLPLLLSQPVSRTKIWAEKMSVTAVLALSVLCLHAYAWRHQLQVDSRVATVVAISLISVVLSSVYWTLVAR